jgi:hypothetical protein
MVSPGRISMRASAAREVRGARRPRAAAIHCLLWISLAQRSLAGWWIREFLSVPEGRRALCEPLCILMRFIMLLPARWVKFEL